MGNIEGNTQVSEQVLRKIDISSSLYKSSLDKILGLGEKEQIRASLYGSLTKYLAVIEDKEFDRDDIIESFAVYRASGGKRLTTNFGMPLGGTSYAYNAMLGIALAYYEWYHSGVYVDVENMLEDLILSITEDDREEANERQYDEERRDVTYEISKIRGDAHLFKIELDRMVVVALKESGGDWDEMKKKLLYGNRIIGTKSYVSEFDVLDKNRFDAEGRYVLSQYVESKKSWYRKKATTYKKPWITYGGDALSLELNPFSKQDRKGNKND